jgi:thiol:disulfide interchange protein DsbD
MIEDFTRGIAAYLQESFLLAYLAVYFGGVLASFSSCVYPVIPITISFIGAHGSGSKVKGFLLSIAYVAGMSVTYMVLGGVAALSGKLFGQIQASPWAYFFVANICILMSLSMLGIFNLHLPVPAFVSRLQPREKKENIIGSFLVGAVSGLVVSPCTTPVLTVILSFVATRQNFFLGMSLLFVFAFGLGTILIILGTFAGLIANMPKSGIWIQRINLIFGWILLGIGEYFLIISGKMWI